jgi:hypothetical protein
VVDSELVCKSAANLQSYDGKLMLLGYNRDMRDENPSPVHRQLPADDLTAAAWLWVVLSPATVELDSVAAKAGHEAAERPKAARADDPDPSASAHMVIKSVPLTVEATGRVPGNDAPAVFATLGITAVGITGIMGALMTADVAAEHSPANMTAWFVALALAQLGVALAVIFRVGRRAHSGHPRPEAPQPVPASQPSQPPRDQPGRTTG